MLRVRFVKVVRAYRRPRFLLRCLMMRTMTRWLFVAVTLLAAASVTTANHNDGESLLLQGEEAPPKSIYHAIRVVDRETGNGVPMTLVRTTNYLQFYTDSAGYVAFYEPGLMNQPVWFSVLVDGYVLAEPSANHGKRNMNQEAADYDLGVAIITAQNRTTVVELNRTQVAETLYRLTGGGLYRDAWLTGHYEDIPKGYLLDRGSGGNKGLIDPQTRSIGQDPA